jgi:hypothetical protein
VLAGTETPNRAGKPRPAASKIAAFDPKAFVYSSLGRLVFLIADVGGADWRNRCAKR